MDPDDLPLDFLAARTQKARNSEVEEVASKRPGLREGGAHGRFTSAAATMNSGDLHNRLVLSQSE